MQDTILEMLIEKDEITWQSIIHEMVRSGQIDPWDVNITDLTKKYIEVLKKLKELDLRVSGKVVLAAALLLRMKSSKLLEEDLNDFDRLIAATEEMTEEEFYSDLEGDAGSALMGQGKKESYTLMPRNPLPRKRKVSIYDLIESLERALHVKQRRIIRTAPTSTLRIPDKTTDMTLVIRSMYRRIVEHFKERKEGLTFSKLLPSETKLDKVYTFIPLLHLTNQRRIDLDQKEHFGDIDITLLKKSRVAGVEDQNVTQA